VPLGQIRGDFFETLNWQLREYRTFFDGGGAPNIVLATSGASPTVQFYDSNFDPALDPEFQLITDPVLFSSERAAFQSAFTSARVAELLAPELGGGPLTAFEIVTGFGVAFPARTLEFQNTSQLFADDVPQDHISPDFETAIGNAITSQGVTTVTAEMLVNRAGAISCAGCHAFSNDVVIAEPTPGNFIRWPLSNGFTHVAHDGLLSDALRSFFLPARQQGMTGFLATPPPAQAQQLGAASATAQGNQEDTPWQEFQEAQQARLEHPQGGPPGLLKELRGAIRGVRRFEEQKAGAFVPVRRTH
jgi:hypothetical protein